jgi:hypothetical protein
LKIFVKEKREEFRAKLNKDALLLIFINCLLTMVLGFGNLYIKAFRIFYIRWLQSFQLPTKLILNLKICFSSFLDIEFHKLPQPKIKTVSTKTDIRI